MTTPARSRWQQHSNVQRDLTRRSQGIPFPGQRNMEIKDQDKEDVAEATAKKFRSFGLEVSTWPQRKSSHQTVSATTRRKDIIKGTRGEGKRLEYSWQFLSTFCSSGIGIETFGRVASLAGQGKAVSVGISCFFSLSSSCTNRGRSRVCFHGRRSRKTKRDEQKWQMESAQKWYLEVCKALGQLSSQRKNEPTWRAEPLVA